jgi:hypothetical protein
MSIEHKLKTVKTDTRQMTLIFRVDKVEHRIIQMVAKTWGLSMAEMTRRCIRLCIAQIKDKPMLERIKVIKNLYIGDLTKDDN